MSIADVRPQLELPARLELPPSLKDQLLRFRQQVWKIKLLEGLGAAVFAIGMGYLTLFVSDRVWPTPTWARCAIFGGAMLGSLAFPRAVGKWVWGQRTTSQLARLIARRYPQMGDQLLGIIELVENRGEQTRSMELCRAAISQVADVTKSRDLISAIPRPRHWAWLLSAALPTVVAVLLAVAFPAAAANSWSRFWFPTSNIARFTFTAIEPLPSSFIVPHGEATTVAAVLLPSTQSSPADGWLKIGQKAAVTAPLRDGVYPFEIAPQIDSQWMSVAIGDYQQQVRVEPTLRPELVSLQARIEWPAYLERVGTAQKDVRGGSLAVVNGSRFRLEGNATRNLKWAKAGETAAQLQSDSFTTESIAVDGAAKLDLTWQDNLGLAARQPFVLNVAGKADAAPTLACDDLPRQKVLLNSEQLTFHLRTSDDFGVKRIGMEWKGLDTTIEKPAKGERVLAGGGPHEELLSCTGTFSAVALGIEPQPVEVRLFAEDYLPGRGRVYSAPYVWFVLSPDDHVIWLTDQLSKWHRQALEVRDRELQLYATNEELRSLDPEQLEKAENQRRLEAQAAGERANGRRLGMLSNIGDDLVRQAMRNPEFGVGHLEKWAEMLAILKDISANRMPSVADLLKDAAQANSAKDSPPGTPKPNGPQVGQVKSTKSGPAGNAAEPKPDVPKPAVPTLTDVESGQQPGGPPKEGPPAEPEDPKKPSSPRLGLPVTTVIGNPQAPKAGPKTPAQAKVDEAVQVQKDLLAEFEKVADELNQILANLEGSTLVKRLKAASRQQYKVAGKMMQQVPGLFGLAARKAGASEKSVVGELAEVEEKGSQNVSYIMDDLEAYFERRPYQKFKVVLDDMKKQDPVGGLRALADDLPKEAGMSISQAEFWSDTFDRWAEDLVDPACKGKCPGCKSKASLPPSLVLEAMQILEAEINLREETRVAEQSKAAVSLDIHKQEAARLSETQNTLRNRTDELRKKILELEDSEANFGPELKICVGASRAMGDASDLLAGAETGKAPIAAETEAIELFLQSKRINPKGGGGGGSSPGGGGGGTTNDSALTLVGVGANQKEVREDQGTIQSTGNTGRALPEEFRAGLDQYFNRLESGPKAQ